MDLDIFKVVPFTATITSPRLNPAFSAGDSRYTYPMANPIVVLLTTDARKLFLSISETDFGFTGITKQISEVRSYIPNIMVERPTIEDIMLGNIGGEK